MKLYKVNIQTILNGFLVGCGTYDAERLGQSVDYIEQYCAEQKVLPLEQRHLPPYFEIIDTEAKADTPEQKLEQKTEAYAGKTKKELLEICKQRGIEANKNMSNPDLINLLIEADKKVMDDDENENPFGFKTSDDFISLSVEEQVEYLDSIFALPEGIDEDSDEAVEYMNALEVIVKTYGGLSIEQEAIDKIKEIVDYLNGEE